MHKSPTTSAVGLLLLLPQGGSLAPLSEGAVTEGDWGSYKRRLTHDSICAIINLRKAAWLRKM